MTFSLVGRCADTGRLGVVVTSSSPAVAARCAWGRAGTGAVSTQNITDPRLGTRVLDALAGGLEARDALDTVLAASEHAGYRQVLVVDSSGRASAHSGEFTLGRHAHAVSTDAAAAGNLLASELVPAAMVDAFTETRDEDLSERLLAALQAGVAAGGEEGPIHSAGLLVVDAVAWPVTDLRIDWSDDPVAELLDLWELWAPQADDYVTRALDPRQAPSYGVPGDK
jgi:uncharacterized Ntn-hydrolase superfamily protein